MSLGRALRAVWLSVGIGLALFGCSELAYRSQGFLHAREAEWRAGKRLPNPSAELLAESYSTTEHMVWHPYIYPRRRPFTGKYTTIDSLGLRKTVQAVPEVAGGRELFMFGASPLSGAGLRDSTTIPSRLSAALAACGIRDVAIRNFGEGGAVFTQEVIDLMLQLRAGKRPSVVVFYDGYNDLAAAMNDGHAGHTKGEEARARDFEAGSILFAWQHDARTELKVLGAMMKIAGSRSLLLQRFSIAKGNDHPPNNITDDSLVNDVVHTYAAEMGIVRALEKEYGFTAFYAWMPMLDPKQKRMSPFEAQLARDMSLDPWTVRFLRLHQMTVERMQPIMSKLEPGRFVELSGLFANDNATVYVEQGHTTEAASDVIAEALAGYLTPLLSRRPVRSESTN